MNNFTLELMDDSLRNVESFVAFLVDNQGKDITIEVNQESHCLRANNVYALVDKFSFKSVTFYTSNAIEQHDRYKIVKRFGWYHWLTRANKFDYASDYSWNQSKVFGCFFGRPSASRLGIASYLHAHYPDKSLIKVRFDTTSEDTRKNFELQKLYSWNNDLSQTAGFFDNIEKYQSDFHAYDYKTFEYDFSNPMNYLYRDIFVDIIVEANLAGDSFYPTEKLVRAILCRKPFIVMAPTYYLKYLKQMGFKTFSDHWSESYDDLGEKNRYFAVLQLIDKLANLSTAELLDLNTMMSATIEHNYQLLTSSRFKKTVTKINE